MCVCVFVAEDEGPGRFKDRWKEAAAEKERLRLVRTRLFLLPLFAYTQLSVRFSTFYDLLTPYMFALSRFCFCFARLPTG